MTPGIISIICAAPNSAGTPEIKVGDTLAFVGKPRTVPPGWLVCDGRWVSVDDYPFLFAAIGHRFSGGWVRRFIAGRGRPGKFRLPNEGQAEGLRPRPCFDAFHELRGKS